MKSKTFKWYQITGYAVEDGEKTAPFTYMVESESPHNVLKLHGGRKQCPTAEGKWVTVQFPTKEKDVKLMPNWTPTDVYMPGGLLHSAEVTKVIPVTKYVCSCGREHYSEHPYRSMWCKCGQKAYPVPYPWENQAPLPPSEGTHPDL